MDRKLIVTHHAPDLDAITSCWLLKKFDTQHYGNAKFAFVNPGDTISETQLAELEFEPTEVVHVDTGLGEFDHHQPERGHVRTSASQLVLEHVTQVHPDLADDEALKLLVDFVTGIDHFEDAYWPDANHPRYNFMLHQIIKGLEFIELHDDDSQLHFGFTALEGTYSALKQHVAAEKILKEDADYFEIKEGRCMAAETKNDDVLKMAQKNGAVLVARKDPELGNVRVKARPDSELDLKDLHEAILKIDDTGSWYYHPSGKMLINGSRKHSDQQASPLSLAEITQLIKEIYG